jgi:hypothetical protein
MDEANRGESCIDKARANGEPTFTLRAQDITAHLLVELWVEIQREITVSMEDGMTLTEAVENARYAHRIPRMIFQPEGLSAKLRGALEIAKAMMGWPNRKLAD